MRKLLTLCLMVLFVLGMTLTTQAMTVFDPTNYSANLANKLKLVESYIRQGEQLANQVKQLENEAKNLAKLDPASLAGVNQQINGTLQQLATVNQQIQAIGTDFADLQQQWDSTFKDFGDFNGMTGKDYADYNKKLMDTTQQKIKRAVASQGLASDGNINADILALGQLLNNSQNAEGALGAIQAANQIAALQIQQMMKMQKIMADSFGAQAIYYQEMQTREKAAAQRMQDFLTIETPNTQVEQGTVDHFSK